MGDSLGRVQSVPVLLRQHQKNGRLPGHPPYRRQLAGLAHHSPAGSASPAGRAQPCMRARILPKLRSCGYPSRGLRLLAVAVLAAATACGPFAGPGGPPPVRAAVTGAPPAGPPPGPAAVVLRPGPAGTYSLSLVFAGGRVVGPVTARLRTVLPAARTAGGLPVVSASDSRVYFLDGDTDVRFLDRNGSQGSATHVAGRRPVEAGFAASPADLRNPVAMFDTSADPSTMRLSVEDLAGGTEHRDLPAPTDAAPWPIGWRAGALVLALGSAPTRNVADNPYGTFAGYSLVDAETGLRLAGIDCNPTGPLTPAGTACLAGTSTLAVADFSNRVRGLETAAGGSSIASAAESPDGARVAYCCAAGQLQLWDLGSGSVRGLGAAGGQSFGWVDGTHLLVADPSGQRGRLVDVTTGAAVPVPASGRVVGRLPGGL